MNHRELETGVQIGDFRIERRLGSGGMGVVYQARQISLDRPVALKVLGAVMSEPAHLYRFRREAQAVAKLHHPGIATLYFAGQDEHSCYMVMELIDGVTLRQLISALGTTHKATASIPTLLKESTSTNPKLARGHLADFTIPDNEQQIGPESLALAAITPEADVVISSKEYIRAVCEIIRDAAVAHAHDQGVIHRDIKPQNIMLDRQGHLHIIDFGVAWFFEADVITDTGQLVGTPMYMSPEQVAGHHVDQRTDVYSLGMTMYELLTLRRPLHAPTREGILRGIVTKAMVPVSWKNPAVSRPVENVVHKAIARDPDERYQSAAEFAGDLQRCMQGEPVVATSYRFKFDEREISASRPWEITAASIWFFLAGTYYLLAYLPFLLNLMQSGSRVSFPLWLFPNRATAIGCYGGFCIVAWVTGWQLLAGRWWARWLSVPVIAVAIAHSLTYVAEQTAFALQQETWPERLDYLMAMSNHLVPQLFVLLGGAGVLCLLLVRRKSKDWFNSCEELRAEHERMLETSKPARNRNHKLS